MQKSKALKTVRRGIGKAASGKNIQPKKRWRGRSARNMPGKRAGTAQTFPEQVIQLVNRERTNRGIPPLIADERLGRLAELKSIDMRDLNYFSHDSPTYGTPDQMLRNAGIAFNYWGENIAWGQATPEEVMRSWMNSPGHRNNILNPSFTRIGVGVATGGPRRILWTQLFIG